MPHYEVAGSVSILPILLNGRVMALEVGCGSTLEVQVSQSNGVQVDDSRSY